MTSNVDKATMSICDSDNCSRYDTHLLECTSIVVTLFFFHFGGETTCEISRWVKQVLSRGEKTSGGKAG
jgi:hypothetical protein